MATKTANVISCVVDLINERVMDLDSNERWTHVIGTHTITHTEDGVLYCTCRAWKFQRKPAEERTCKHIEQEFPTYAPSVQGAPARELRPPEVFLLSSVASGKLRSIHNLNEFYWSEKYDGVRAVWDGESLVSRTGKAFAAPPWFLEGMPNVKLDGELWIDGQSLPQINAAVHGRMWRGVEYMVFDSPEWPEETFYTRQRNLDRLQLPAHVVLVEQLLVVTPEELLQDLNQVTDMGGEGIVLRHWNALYEPGRDHRYGLKCKLVSEGEGKVQSVGANSVVNVVVTHPAESKDVVIHFKVVKAHDQVPSVGDRVRFHYRGLTTNKKPKYPSFVGVVPAVAQAKKRVA